MTEEVYKSTFEKFVEDINAICDTETRMPDYMAVRAKNDGIVIFSPHMGDHNFTLGGALNDICPQPGVGYQPQPESWRNAFEIHIDSEGFTIWKDAERHECAARIRLYEVPGCWLVEPTPIGMWRRIPSDIVKMKDAKHSRAWYLLFERKHLPVAPPGSKRGCDRINEIVAEEKKDND